MPVLFLLTPLKLLLLGLILVLGLTTFYYSWVAFSGESDRPRFLGALTRIISAVTVLIISNHIVVFWCSWVSVGLCLHRLILFYPRRPRARLAAQKQFVSARLGEVLLGAAFVALYRECNSLYINEIILRVSTVDADSRSITTAAILLTIVALVKCAQLPMHGWLTQVVEAPTPVSSLLHAGVVNLGGILLLFFSPVIESSSLASWLLIAFAGASTILAGLTSATRVSIKVKLAWSTSSQMGLMLLEIALGLYTTAILHILSHSLYKSYSFLSCGNTVNRHLATRLAGSVVPKKIHWLMALLLAFALVGTAQWKYLTWPSASTATIIWLALATLLLPSITKSCSSCLFLSLGVGILLIAFYTTVEHWLTLVIRLHTQVDHHADYFVSSLFLTMFLLSLALHYWPRLDCIKRLFILVNTGAYLDEWVTCLTLKLWPKGKLAIAKHWL